MRTTILLLMISAFAAVPAAAQVTIGSPGGSQVRSWGKTNSQTYGQTITVGATNVLTDFSFWLGEGVTSTYDLNFTAYVYQWSSATSRIVGPMLFSSAIENISGTSASPNVKRTFSTGGIALSSGSMYALFLSTSGLTGTGRTRFAASSSDQYAGGSFVFQNNGEDFGSLSSSEWTVDFLGDRDLQFEANFVRSVSVPEPGTVMLLVSGVLLMLIGARRKGSNFET